MHKACWDILYKELTTEPPVYDQMIKILAEIRNLFCEFVYNRPDIQEETKDKIVPELIKNMVEHQAFDDNNLYGLTI